MGIDIQQRISQWHRSSPTQTNVAARRRCAYALAPWKQMLKFGTLTPEKGGFRGK